MTHAKVERAGNDRHRSVCFEMDGAQFLTGRRGHLEIAANAQPAQEATLFAFAPALVKAGIVGSLQRLLEYAKKIAAVVRHVGGGPERQVAFANDVAPAQVEAVDAKLARREIERALHVIVAFGPACAAIG